MLGISGFSGSEDLGGEGSRVFISTGSVLRTEGSSFKSLRGFGRLEPEIYSLRYVLSGPSSGLKSLGGVSGEAGDRILDAGGC
jgi:hypothetical protein